MINRKKRLYFINIYFLSLYSTKYYYWKVFFLPIFHNTSEQNCLDKPAIYM